MDTLTSLFLNSSPTITVNNLILKKDGKDYIFYSEETLNKKNETINKLKNNNKKLLKQLHMIKKKSNVNI